MVPPGAEEFQLIIRPTSWGGETEGFVQQLKAILEMIAMKTGAERASEPRRLFNAKENRAAVIAAMTQLEATLRKRLNKEVWTVVNRPMSLRSLVDRAIESQVLPQTAQGQIREWTQVRNEAVHTSKAVLRNEAKAVVEGVERLLLTLE
jgi:hypothetical protein